jgi:FkbM family methyltransferase
MWNLPVTVALSKFHVTFGSKSIKYSPHFMFRDRLASVFRTLNANLLYVNSPLLEKLLKVPFYLSTKFYQRAKNRKATSEKKIIHFDKTIAMNVDIAKSIGGAFYWMGFHELNETRFLHRHLKKSMVLLDVGANQGEVTLFAAKRLTEGKVYAFEPLNDLFSLLNSNVALNGFQNITTFNFGLSNQSATVPFYLGREGPGENEGLGTMFQSVGRNRFVQNIALRTLDEVAVLNGISQIDFIKIDVEGAELMVLQGGRKTISAMRPVVMIEYSEDTYNAAGYSGQEIQRYFAELNYTMNEIKKGGYLQKISSPPHFCNLVFTPAK